MPVATGLCLLLLAACLSGCRCTVAVALRGDATAAQEADKDYDGNTLDAAATLKLPLTP